MIANFLIVLGQVLSLFLMIAVGFGMYKAKMLNDAGAAQMTDLLLYAVTPCVVIHAFCRDFDPGDGVWHTRGNAALSQGRG